MKNILKKLNKLAISGFLGLLSACSTASSVDEAKPAVLIGPSDSNTQIIEQVISQILNGKKVNIVRSAFLHSNQLLIEKKAYSSINTPAIDGLILGGPRSHLFSLYSKGKSCYLIDAKTGNQYPLNSIKCKVL